MTAARALHRAGWRVGVGMPRRGGGLLSGSRAVQAVHVVPRPSGGEDAFVAGVRRAQAQGRYDVVVGSGDDWMAALSHCRDQVPVPVAHPPPDVVTAGMDKLGLARLAEEVGLGTPATWAAPSQGGPTPSLPVVVKNRSHWTPGQSRRHRIEAAVCRSDAELREHLETFRRAEDEPVLQELIDGQLTALVGVMHGGRLLGRVQQVSPRLWPTPSGASARARTVPLDESLAGPSEVLLRRLDWTGLVELQFLVGGDGVPRLIDLNGRYYGSLALAEHARPGLVDAAARAALGLGVPELGDGRPGVRYHWLSGDLRRAARERRGGMVSDVLDTMGWAIGARHSLLSLADPGPALALVTGRLSADRGDDPVADLNASGSAAAPQRRRSAPEHAARPAPTGR